MSGSSDAHWCNPADITYKISPFLDLPAVKGGDWDTDRRHLFQNTAKYRSIVQRFVEGREWLDTDLFTDVYPRRLAKTGRVGRCKTIQELAQDYERRFSKLYASLQRHGFRTETPSGRKLSLPAFLIGRDGDVFIGNQGNHRLAMAQVLGLDKIAGRVVCRHKNWTP